MKQWLSIALRRDIVARARKVSLLVGTLLVAINQGDLLLNGAFSIAILAKILLTYFIPYAVSTYASVEAIRQ